MLPIEKVRLVGYGHSRIACEKSQFGRSWKSSFEAMAAFATLHFHTQNFLINNHANG